MVAMDGTDHPQVHYPHCINHLPVAADPSVVAVASVVGLEIPAVLAKQTQVQVVVVVEATVTATPVTQAVVVVTVK